MNKLDAAAIAAGLRSLPAWRHEASDEALVGDFRFEDFAQAFAFMSELALYSERVQHHPEWRNVYNRLQVRLSTHDAGGISERDFAWAAVADRAYMRYRIGGEVDR